MCSASGVTALAECARVETHETGAAAVVVEYSNIQIAEIIDEYIHSERDRAILKRRLIDGICFEPLAEEFDLSTVQIKRIIYKGQEKVFKHL